jgi:3-oxoacyl-[acyl-carrier-protein] synthase II
MGIVSPLGRGLKSNWEEGLLKARSGIMRIPDYYLDVNKYAVKIAAVVPRGTEPNQFDEASSVPAKDQKKMDLFIKFAMVAADDAIADAGLVLDTEEQKERAGVIIGSGIGGLTTVGIVALELDKKEDKRVSPFFIPSILINITSGWVSMKHGLKGPNLSVVTACATGTHAIGDAARVIALGDADIMVAGGTEAAIDPLGVAGFTSVRALSLRNDEPERASRPWDKGRDGFVIGEGAGVLVLEEYEHAKARGAKIYAEVVGYGCSGDAYHLTAPAPEGEGGLRAMKAALKSADMEAREIDYINAHGTSTPVGDMQELAAIRNLFKDNLSEVSISSTKSSVGHLLGAAGAVEAIYSILAIRDQIAPPTLNLDDPDEGTEGMDLVPFKPKPRKINSALSNSFGFGGTNACLIFKKV